LGFHLTSEQIGEYTEYREKCRIDILYAIGIESCVEEFDEEYE